MTHANALPSQMQRTVHAIYHSDGNLRRITMDDTDAEMAATEGQTVSYNIPVFEVLDDVINSGPPSETMDDKTWRFIRSDLVTGKAEENAISPVNPPDLPFVLASQRLSLVLRFFNPQSAQSYAELSEIIMAGNNRRDVERGIFSKESQAASFAAELQEPLDQLWEAYEIADEYAGEISTQNRSERALYGDSGPGSAIAEAFANQRAIEMKYVLDILDDEKEEPITSVDDFDVPY